MVLGLFIKNLGMILFLFGFVSFFAFVDCQSKNLVVAGAPLAVSLEMKRNSSGHIVELIGVSALMLDWLSLRYKFNYSILQVNDTVLESTEIDGDLPGLISYVVNGQSDAIMAAIKLTPDRFRYLDFVHPWMYARSAFLIPMPEESRSNILAVVKPFHCSVWIALISSFLAVVVALSCLGRCLHPVNSFSVTNHKKHLRPTESFLFNDVVVYVLTTLLNQGGSFSSNAFKIRLVAGAWCLVTLVLANVYNSILISYVASNPRVKPLVESPDDLLGNRDIHLVVEKGQGADVIFSKADSGIFKAFGDKLKAYSKSRCLVTEQCIELVKSSPYRHVYFNTRVVLLSVIHEEFRKTGLCNLVEAGERYSDNTAFCWGLTKNSPHTEQFNRGVMSMREMGLISLWERWFEPDIRSCLLESHIKNRRKKNKQKKPLVRLSVTNLTGAFVLLAIGYTISLVIFIKEKIVFFSRTQKKLLVS